jgi:hypothetical protein
MIPDLIAVLIVIMVMLVAWWASHRVLEAVAAPVIMATIVDVVLVCVFLIWLLRWTGLGRRAGIV